MTCNNEADFGRAGIQYVHYPAYSFPRPTEDLRWYHGPQVVVDAYYAIADRIAHSSPARMAQNITLVNSNWTGRKVFERHGIATRTLYPPVTGDFEDVGWDDRTNGFLCIGRISPEKHLDTVIDILSAVHRTVPGISLRLVGTAGPRRYYEHIAARVREEGAWVTLDENLSRRQLLELLPRYRYGIHGMPEEHFGMAPAEMAAAGCIVFVPRGGGQVEIVAENEHLTYRSTEEAVGSILAVLADRDLQLSLRALLRAQRERFSIGSFMEGVRGAVAEIAAGVRS